MGLEIFHSKLSEQTEDTCFWNKDDNEPSGEGYYYWYCFPGCLPEGDPIGPFDSENEAQRDAIENNYCDWPGHEVSIEKAPACWASYLINGDSSGIDDKDIKQCDAWTSWLSGGHVEGTLGESYFGTFEGMGYDLLNYIVHREIEID